MDFDNLLFVGLRLVHVTQKNSFEGESNKKNIGVYIYLYTYIHVNVHREKERYRFLRGLVVIQFN